jgi:hypothetical protein
MTCSGMLRRVALVRTDVSEEHSASFIRVTRIGELGTTLAVTNNRRTQRRNNILYIELYCSTTISSQRALLVTADVSSSPILDILMIEVLRSSETSPLKGHTAYYPKRRHASVLILSSH